MATAGHSTVFEFGNAATVEASTTWTEFAEITDIKPPEIEADDIETSHMQSPEQFKEFIAGWADAGEVEVTCNFLKTNNAAVYALFRQNKGFRMTFEDGSVWKFNGYIKKFANEVDREKIVTAVATVKVNGKPEFVAAAASGN